MTLNAYLSVFSTMTNHAYSVYRKKMGKVTMNYCHDQVLYNNA